MNSLFPAHLGVTSPLLAPPANLEAEQALLGALLANNKAYDRVSSFLEAHHFADAVHGRIYAAIRARCERGELADAVTLRREFEKTDELAEVGGLAYLARLIEAMVGIVNAGEYGRLIYDCYQCRRLIEACDVARERAHGASTGEGDAQMRPGDILLALDAELAAISRDGVGGQDARSTETVITEVMGDFQAALERRGGMAGVTTGYAGLDRMLGGFQRQQLILLAGRPAMGKTAISLGIAMRAAAAGVRVFYASAEMAAPQVLARGAAAVAGLPVSVALRAGMETEDGGWRSLEPRDPEVRAMGEAARLISRLPILWDDSSGATVAGIRAKARQAKQRGGLGLIVVDYLQRLRSSSHALRYGNRVQEVSEQARALKEMARELDVPVLALSQLSRDVEKRDDKRPVISDLRDSGELEQEADTVLMLYRDHYYATKERPVRNKNEKSDAYASRIADWMQRVADSEGRGEIIVRKQRQGREGPVRLRWQGDRSWFFNDAAVGEPAVPGLQD